MIFVLAFLLALLWAAAWIIALLFGLAVFQYVIGVVIFRMPEKCM